MSRKPVPMSPQLYDLVALWHRTIGDIDRGMDRETCLTTLELGLRTVFPVVPNHDPRIWRRCYICDDTGYAIDERYDGRVGYRARFATPCTCERGVKRATAFVAYDQNTSERGRGHKKPGWVRA